MTIAVTCTATSCTIYLVHMDYHLAMNKARQRMWDALGSTGRLPHEDQEHTNYRTMD